MDATLELLADSSPISEPPRSGPPTSAGFALDGVREVKQVAVSIFDIRKAASALKEIADAKTAWKKCSGVADKRPVVATSIRLRTEQDEQDGTKIHSVLSFPNIDAAADGMTERRNVSGFFGQLWWQTSL